MSKVLANPYRFFCSYTLLFLALTNPFHVQTQANLSPPWHIFLKLRFQLYFKIAIVAEVFGVTITSAHIEYNLYFCLVGYVVVKQHISILHVYFTSNELYLILPDSSLLLKYLFDCADCILLGYFYGYHFACLSLS